MSLTIELSPEVEVRLRRTAERSGVAANAYAARAITDRLVADGSKDAPAAVTLNAEDSVLLTRINAGLSAVSWERYDALQQRRRAGQLRPGDRDELIDLTDQIERANADRIGHLAALAWSRGVTLSALADRLGIAPHPAEQTSE